MLSKWVWIWGWGPESLEVFFHFTVHGFAFLLFGIRREEQFPTLAKLHYCMPYLGGHCRVLPYSCREQTSTAGWALWFYPSLVMLFFCTTNMFWSFWIKLKVLKSRTILYCIVLCYHNDLREYCETFQEIKLFLTPWLLILTPAVKFPKKNIDIARAKERSMYFTRKGSSSQNLQGSQNSPLIQFIYETNLCYSVIHSSLGSQSPFF